MPSPAQTASDQPRLCGGFGSQAMVDDEPEDRSAVRAHPVAGKQRERGTVGPARNRHRQPRLRLERTQALEKARELRSGERGGRFSCSRRRSSHG